MHDIAASERYVVFRLEQGVYPSLFRCGSWLGRVLGSLIRFGDVAAIGCYWGCELVRATPHRFLFTRQVSAAAGGLRVCSEGILKALQRKPFSVALIVLAGLLLASQASYAVGSVGGLPKEGDQVAPEWRVEKLATHPEFHRFVLRHEDGATTGVEVTHRRSTEGQAAVYVVQPAPGESPPAALLDAFRARLKSLPKPGELTKRVVMEKASEKSSLSLYAWLLVLVLV